MPEDHISFSSSLSSPLIAIASDHAGWSLKNKVTTYFKSHYTFLDLGPTQDTRCDYPEKAWSVVTALAEEKANYGILICGTGIGMSIAANRHPKIRAALAHNEWTAQMARQHNQAQILCLGARVLDEHLVYKMISLFLTTPFDGGRHQNRVDQLSNLSS